MNADAKPAAKRRPWFQVHLSTCVILMFVAGALLWANVAERRRDYFCAVPSAPLTSEQVEIGRNTERFDYYEDSRSYQGWPWVHRTSQFGEVFHRFERGRETAPFSVVPLADASWDLDLLALDAVVALAILAAVAAACETWTRRRPRRGRP